MRRRDLLAGAGALALGAAAIGQRSLADDKIILKASDVHPEGYPTVEAVENLGRKLEAATNGRLSVQMFASMQLGGEKETIEQTQVGAIQLVRCSVGTLGPVVDDINIFNLPFVFHDVAHMRKVVDGEIGQDLLDKVTNHPTANLVGLCWMDAGARSFYTIKKPIHSIEDLKGLKIRVIGNPMFVDMANALGANGVAMGYDQVFSALQTGVIDGAENNPPSFVFDNHYQVAKFYSDSQHLIIPEMLVFSKLAWNKLSTDDQALIKKYSKEAQADARVLWDKKEADAFERMKTGGVEVDHIADKKPFRDAVKPVWDKYGAKYADWIKRIDAVT
jgi:tripartite ATP-independent transporter DctP family solute receptor